MPKPAASKDKPAASVQPDGSVWKHTDDPLEILGQGMNDPTLPKATRLKLASTLAQYTHTRTRDGGKKDAATAAAKKLTEGAPAETEAPAAPSKFAPSAPPPLRRVS